MLQIAFLIALIRLLVVTGRYFLCAILYTIGTLVFKLVTFYSLANDGANFISILGVTLIKAVITFVSSLLYFWLLQKFEGILWWCIAVGAGFLILTLVCAW